MAKCDCGDAEVECKCGCGCACIIDDSIPIQDRCFLIRCKCPDSGPKNSVAGIASITLGLDAFVGRFRTRKPLNGSTMVKFHCKDLPLATLALVFHKISGAKIAVPASKLGTHRTFSFHGRVDDVVKRLGLISMSSS